MSKFRLGLTTLIILIVILGITALSQVKSKIIGETLTVESIEKKWKQVPFSSTAFKNGTPGIRASMTVDIITGKKFIGMDIKDVKTLLGRPTGYFWNDSFPAYILNEGWKDNDSTWQIIFLPDHNGKVTNVVVNKNCC
jgi:hypothetical protein